MQLRLHSTLLAFGLTIGAGCNRQAPVAAPVADPMAVSGETAKPPEKMTNEVNDGEGTQPSRPWANATPSQLLGRFTSSDFNLNAPPPLPVFIPADQQRQLEAWERNVAEGKTRGPILVVVGSGYNNVRLKVLETHLGKPDRTTKEQVKEIIGVAEGVAKPVPLGTRWYGPVGFSFLEDSLVAVFYQPEKPDPKPASSPQFDTPLGYYAGVGQITGKKVKSRALAGLTIVGDKTETKYEYGETKAGPNEALVWVRIHTPKAVKNDVHFDQYSVVIDKKSYPVLASTTDLNAEFAEAIRKATTQHGADKSTYLLFAIPERATKLRLVYGDTGLDLAVPVPTIPEVADEPAKGSVKVTGVSLEKGELTVEIDWGKAPPTLEAKDVTLVLLFQAKSEPIMKLDGPALAKLSDLWEAGLLDNDCTWVLRTAGDAKKVGEVLQIISGSGKAKEGPDFRKNGKFSLRFRLSYSANSRWLNTENVQVALFQQTDPKKWQQTSTNYKLLSNIADVPSK